MELLDTEDLAHFIVENYRNAGKIVEVGVGAYPWVAKRLKEQLPDTTIIVTDVDTERLTQAKEACPGLELACDNVLEPRPEVYEGADLIYSIRPLPELVPEIFRLALRVGCDLLIRPYSDEEGGYDYPKSRGWRLTSRGRAFFYWLKKESTRGSHK